MFIQPNFSLDCRRYAIFHRWPATLRPPLLCDISLRPGLCSGVSRLLGGGVSFRLVPYSLYTLPRNFILIRSSRRSTLCPLRQPPPSPFPSRRPFTGCKLSSRHGSNAKAIDRGIRGIACMMSAVVSVPPGWSQTDQFHSSG